MRIKEIKITIQNLGTEITDTVLSFEREITLEQAGRIIEYIAQTEAKKLSTPTTSTKSAPQENETK